MDYATGRALALRNGPFATCRVERALVFSFDKNKRGHQIYWTVDKCPFCGGQHRHGPAQGLRMAGCGEGHYVLQTATAGGARRRRRGKLPSRQVWDRDDWQCVFCGGHRRLTVDHVIPVSRGGTDDLDNLQTACWSCNSSKGNRDAPKLH
jgi:hypothetical protein